MTTFNASSLNLSIPSIEADFGVSAQLIGWVVTTYSLACVAFSIPFGRLADMTGRVRIMRAGTAIFAASALATVLAPNFAVFLACRFMQGVGGSIIFATSNAILISVYPPEERGKVLGLSVAATYTGLSTGPVVGGFMNGVFGWQSIMLATGIFSVIPLAASIARVSNDEPVEKGGRYDYVAAVLYMASLVSFLYGLSNITNGKVYLALIVLGLAIGAYFVRYELKAENPVLKISLFANKGFTFSNLAAFMNYASTFAVTYYMSIYLQLVKGMTSQSAGLVMLLMPLVQAVLSPSAGKLSDKHSPYKLSSFGMGLCAAGLLVACTSSVDTPIWIIYAMLAVMGLGFAIFSSPNTNAIMSAVDDADRSSASSISSTMRTAGQTTGMAILTIITGVIMGSMSLNDAPLETIVRVMHTSFIVFSGVCFIGIFISLQRKEEKK